MVVFSIFLCFLRVTCVLGGLRVSFFKFFSSFLRRVLLVFIFLDVEVIVWRLSNSFKVIV